MKGIWREIKLYFKTVDLLLLSLCLVASGIGLVLVSSAARTLDGGAGRYVTVQFAAIVMGVLLYLLISLIDVDALCSHWKIMTVFSVLFMALLIPLGTGKGNKSWLPTPFGVAIQPAEIVKLVFILLLAKQFFEFSKKDRLNHPVSVSLISIYLVFTLALIYITSRDGGMIVIYALVFFAMCLAAGIKFRWFAALFALIAAAVPFAWYSLMEDYQRFRLLVGFNPDLDPSDVGYQSILSRISIGGGQLAGQGLYSGAQTQVGRLPAQQTDFIYAVAGEEFGLVGCLIILLVLSLIIIRCFYISTKAKSSLSGLVCVGVGSMILFQTIINVLMCLALTPVIGLTLPFISYGGSSVVALFAAMGLVSSVRRHPLRHWLKDN